MKALSKLFTSKSGQSVIKSQSKGYLVRLLNSNKDETREEAMKWFRDILEDPSILPHATEILQDKLSILNHVSSPTGEEDSESDGDNPSEDDTPSEEDSLTEEQIRQINAQYNGVQPQNSILSQIAPIVELVNAMDTMAVNRLKMMKETAEQLSAPEENTSNPTADLLGGLLQAQMLQGAQPQQQQDTKTTIGGN